ncbi:LysR family transcriptional regulator [Rhodovulum sulfidophilum]|nr:LysR family transcriptional regulator [Rhodovulum sulfidophilum]
MNAFAVDRLTGLSAFVRTADLGSFAAAGRVMGVSPSAVGKAVTKLEDQLQVRLIQRTTRKLSLTDEGRIFHERCRRILDDMEDAYESLQRTRAAPRGKIRVSAPVIAHHLLMPLMPDFTERYPEIEFDLDFSDRVVDLIEEGIDVAIRSGPLPDNRFMVRRLPPFRLLLCASPKYLEQHGFPKTIGDLASHRGIGFRFPNSGKLFEQTVQNPEQHLDLNLPHVMTCNSLEAVREAVIRGIGMGCMPDFLARAPLSTKAIVPLLMDDLEVFGQLNLIWPSSRHLSPKVRAFVDFIVEKLFTENE